MWEECKEQSGISTHLFMHVWAVWVATKLSHTSYCVTVEACTYSSSRQEVRRRNIYICSRDQEQTVRWLMESDLVHSENCGVGIESSLTAGSVDADQESL